MQALFNECIGLESSVKPSGPIMDVPSQAPVRQSGSIVTHQNVLASTLGLPCIPLTTCELRTTSKLVRPQSRSALSTNCFRLASSVRSSPSALVPLHAI